MARSSFLLLSFWALVVAADNDWSTPCLSGVCQYDLPATSGGASGTLKIWGSDAAISDITPAADWEIIDCSPEALQQDIRLVCKEDGSTSCAHLYGGTNNTDNAVGKVVRLPENCGKSAFAVVTKAYTPQDQSIPSNVSASITRRDGSQPKVHGLQLSTNFASAPKTSSGPVNFALRAANVAGANGDITVSPQQQRRSNSRIFGRGISSFVHGAVDDITSLNDFNVNKSTTLQPLDVDKSFNLLDQSLSCGSIEGKVKIDVNAKAHAVASIGVAASGTVVPPKVSDFSIIAGLTASIDGTIDMQASASGTIDSGKIKLFEVGVPGLDFPGILTIGPSFVINGQATATLELEADMTIGLSYDIEGAQLTFPPDNQKSSGSFNIGDTPLKLSVSPSAKATGTVAAHLIPTLNFGISALDDTVSANVFLELDASASMSLSAQADGDASATVGGSADSASEKRGLSRVSLSARTPQADEEEDDGSDGSDDVQGDDGSQDDGSEDDNGDDNGDESLDGSSDDSGSDDSGSEDDGDDSLDAADDDSANDSTDDSADSTDANDGTADDGSDDSNSLDNGDDDSSTAADDNDGADDTDDASSADDTTIDDGDANDDSDADSADDGSNADSDSDSDSADSSTSTDDATSTAADDSSATSTSTADDASETSSSADANQKAASSTALVKSASSSFGGCFEIDSALDVNAGADGSFFGLFDKNTKVNLFSKKFQVLKKCFGSNAEKRSLSSLPRRSPKALSSSRFFNSRSLMHARAGLSCPSEDAAGSNPESIADETVPAKDVTEE
ncbi:hypothetical protein D9613_010280 [Agrocybe pediades]|uniref:Uncharacterized protein n=1 Tax=Agrocybe pediades TaxID=84607 RepID=A0A8H4QFR5_9AGAR|nr:hypothetical protein D9613_010280 [Agrocybe pediades]